MKRDSVMDNAIIKKMIFLILVLAFTPLAFTLMPLIVLLAVSGGIYMLTMAWGKQHHFE